MNTRVAKCGHLVPVHPGRQRRLCAQCAASEGQSPPPSWEILCRGCGIEATVYHQSQCYCAPECRKATLAAAKEAARPVQDCPVCGRRFVRRRVDARFCSSHCGDVHRGQRLAAPLPLRICALPGCDVEFQPNRDGTRCCSEAHGKKLWKIEHPDYRHPWNDRRRDAHHRRRAKKKTTAGRPVLLAEIRERDKNRCHLCGKRVSVKPHPHPLSASLDHLIPLSHDGEHVPENVRLAHLRCNVSKGNRGGNEQLMLIG